ncbi:hypothetical protein QL285_070882 [Trifolium repens]|nr:hypothetical protein QL285_070882 [Trifolium repens]
MFRWWCGEDAVPTILRGDGGGSVRRSPCNLGGGGDGAWWLFRCSLRFRYRIGFRQFNILNNGSSSLRFASSSPDLHFQITGVLDLHQRGPEVTCIVLRLNEGPFSIQSEENRAVA